MRKNANRIFLWAALAVAGVSMPQTVPALAQLPSSASSGAISVTLNGQPINFTGVPPQQVGGRVLVPLRGVFEALGAQVDYDARTRTVFAQRGNTQVQLQIGSTQALVNGQTRVLDIPAQTRLGSTLVPLRFVSEALGAQVQWNDAAKSVLITDTNAQVNPDGTFGNYQPTPTPRPYNPNDNVNTARSVSGTVVKVDPTTPPVLTLRVGTAFRTFTLDENTPIFRQTTGAVLSGQNPVFGNAVPLNGLSELQPNEQVLVRLDNNGNVVDVTSQVSVVTARVLRASGSQIVLDDGRNTTLTIGPNLRFIDARGRVSSTANLQPGQSVTLSIVPSTRRIYQVSAASDGGTYNPPDDNFPDDTPGTNFPNDGSGAPQISLVQHNATRALRAGAVINVTVRGTPNASGTFTVLTGQNEQPLNEDPARPGVYTGTYTVRAGENILNGYVTAFLRNNAGQEAILQSRTPLTIDNIAPRITSTAPRNGAFANSNQPNIVIYANDIGGSGLASANVSINGQRLQPEEITVSPNSVSIVPVEPISGQTSVRATIFDAAGNSASTNFSFTADGNNPTGNNGTGLIGSVTHNATRALYPGDRVSVIITAPAGGRAWFDVLGDGDRVISRNIPLTEDAAGGRYRGSFTIPDTVNDLELNIRGRYEDTGGGIDVVDATAPIQLAGGATNASTRINITTPRDEDTVGSPLTVRGNATPGATVEVSIRAEGVRYYIFEYKEELGTQQIQANNNGSWATQAIALPRPRNVSGLKYVITAVQIDNAGRRSEPVTVTVNPQQ